MGEKCILRFLNTKNLLIIKNIYYEITFFYFASYAGVVWGIDD